MSLARAAHLFDLKFHPPAWNVGGTLSSWQLVWPIVWRSLVRVHPPLVNRSLPKGPYHGLTAVAEVETPRRFRFNPLFHKGLATFDHMIGLSLKALAPAASGGPSSNTRAESFANRLKLVTVN